MKWGLRVLGLFIFVVIISLLVIMPHILGNEVFDQSELDSLDILIKMPCENAKLGRFCK
jgi:hypothetical protein